jgi:rhodanese-related sulfurtransferase
MTGIPTGIPTVSMAGVPDPLPEGLAVLDVREPVEWRHGHIEGALHIPLRDLPGRLDEVPTGQTLVVCRVGGRSAQAAAYLLQQGRDVVNLDGGMLDWEAAGRALVSETGQPPVVV